MNNLPSDPSNGPPSNLPSTTTRQIGCFDLFKLVLSGVVGGLIWENTKGHAPIVRLAAVCFDVIAITLLSFFVSHLWVNKTRSLWYQNRSLLFSMIDCTMTILISVLIYLITKKIVEVIP